MEFTELSLYDDGALGVVAPDDAPIWATESVYEPAGPHDILCASYPRVLEDTPIIPAAAVISSTMPWSVHYQLRTTPAPMLMQLLGRKAPSQRVTNPALCRATVPLSPTSSSTRNSMDDQSTPSSSPCSSPSSPLRNQGLESLWSDVPRSLQPCSPLTELYDPTALFSLTMELCAPPSSPQRRPCDGGDVDSSAAAAVAAEEEIFSRLKRRKLEAVPTGDETGTGRIHLTSPRHLSGWQAVEEVEYIGSMNACGTSGEEGAITAARNGLIAEDKQYCHGLMDQKEVNHALVEHGDLGHSLIDVLREDESGGRRPAEQQVAPLTPVVALAAAAVKPPTAVHIEPPRIGRGGVRRARTQSLLGAMTPAQPASPVLAAPGSRHSPNTEEADDSSECGEEAVGPYGLDGALWTIVERGDPCNQPSCEYHCPRREVSMRRHFHARCNHVHRKGKREGLPFYTHQREKAYKHQRLHQQEERKARGERSRK